MDRGTDDAGGLRDIDLHEIASGFRISGRVGGLIAHGNPECRGGVERV